MRGSVVHLLDSTNQKRKSTEPLGSEVPAKQSTVEKGSDSKAVAVHPIKISLSAQVSSLWV